MNEQRSALNHIRNVDLFIVHPARTDSADPLRNSNLNTITLTSELRNEFIFNVKAQEDVEYTHPWCDFNNNPVLYNFEKATVPVTHLYYSVRVQREDEKEGILLKVLFDLTLFCIFRYAVDE